VGEGELGEYLWPVAGGAREEMPERRSDNIRETKTSEEVGSDPSL